MEGLGGRFSSIDRGELQKLRDEWMILWKNYGEPEGGIAELWAHAVINWLEARGDRIYPKELIRAEERLVQQGLASELLHSLLNVVSPDFTGAASDEERFIDLLHATSDERKQALKEIAGGKP